MKNGRFFTTLVFGWVILSSISFGYSGWIAGKAGNALGFDGVNDYVEVMGYQGITGTQSRTCCAWIKTSTTQQCFILSWGANQAGQKWAFRIEANGTLSTAVYGGYVNTTTTVNDGQWYYVAAVLNDDGSPTADEILLYIDGIVQSTTASSSQSINTVASQNVLIGAFENGGVPDGHFTGLLDEVCIYGRALEPNELDPEVSIPTEGLIAHWAMDETAGKIAHDSTLSHDGTLRCMISGYSGGSGTIEDPYQIANKQDLLELTEFTEDYSKCFILTTNIDLEGQVFTSAIISADIDNDSSGFQGTSFTGTFDGCDHNISNFEIFGDSYDYLGLFGYIGSGCQIKSLAVENVTINGWYSDSYYLGCLVGYNDGGDISQCCSTGFVLGGSYVGGLVGRNAGNISSCYTTSEIQGSLYVGGIAGGNYYGNVSLCYSTGSVNGVTTTGGLIGVNYYGTIEQCYSSSSVTSFDFQYTGGLVGYNNNGNINQCYSITGTISGCRYVGGLVGINDGTISNCYTSNAVDGSTYVGGLAGMNLRNISQCYSTSMVNGSSYYSGGFVGENDGYINDCFSTGTVNGQHYTGGLLGSNGTGYVINCYSISSVSGTYNIGGLMAYSYPQSVSNSFWDKETSGLTISYGGTGKTTAQMKTLSTFSSVNWAFSPWIVGRTDNVLCLDGVDDYVHIPGCQGITGTQSRSCVAWIKTTATQQGVILSWGGQNNGEKWMFRVEADGTLAVGVGGGYIYTTTTVNDGQWHHVAAVLNDDGSPELSEIQLYIDGILKSTSSTATLSIATIASQNVILGAFQNSGTLYSYYSGLLDEVCIYGRALDISELDPEVSIPTEGLVAHWTMDETEGTVVHDSVSSYDGILQNPTDSAVWAICEGTNYPRLAWQILDGDWVCPDGVNVEDLDYFAQHWLLENCTPENNYCEEADLDASGNINLQDLKTLAEHWLQGNPASEKWISGKLGNALSFDGVNDYVEVAGYQGVTGTQSRTCGAWIKTIIAQQGTILSWGSPGNGERWLFRIEADGTFAVGVGGGYIHTTTTVNDGQWHHIAAVLNDDGSPELCEIQLYIDGLLQDASATDTLSIATIASQNVMLGAFQNSGTLYSYYNGLLDEVCIYNRALDASEIVPDALPESGLVTHWAMDEASGTMAHDSVSSYDGTLINF